MQKWPTVQEAAGEEQPARRPACGVRPASLPVRVGVGPHWRRPSGEAAARSRSSTQRTEEALSARSAKFSLMQLFCIGLKFSLNGRVGLCIHLAFLPLR